MPLPFGWSRRLSRVLQIEATACGIACLAMVASSYGRDVGLAGLRRRFSTSLKGVNLALVTAMAGQLGLNDRPLKLGRDELGRQQDARDDRSSTRLPVQRGLVRFRHMASTARVAGTFSHPKRSEGATCCEAINIRPEQFS